MLSYCLKCRKKTESKNPRVPKTNKGKLMLISKCILRLSDSNWTRTHNHLVHKRILNHLAK